METNKEKSNEALLNEAVKKLEYLTRHIEHRMETHYVEEWIQPQDLMTMLGISERSLQNLRDRKVLHPTRLGGKLYYSRRELERILEEGYRRSLNGGRM